MAIVGGVSDGSAGLVWARWRTFTGVVVGFSGYCKITEFTTKIPADS